jgi:hypothetical protein
MPAFGYSPEDMREWDRTGIDPHSPLAVPCRVCRAPTGEKCRNYLGKGKQTCKERGTPEPTAPTWQPDLFRPTCARSVAEQTELFGTDDPRDQPHRCPACGHSGTAELCSACGERLPPPARLPDLPGQSLLF